MPVPATAHGGVSLADPLCYAPLSSGRHKNVLGKKCYKTPTVTFTHNTNGLLIGRSFQGSLRAVGGISSKATPILLNPAPPSDFLSRNRGGLLGLTPTPPSKQRTLTQTRARTGRTSGLSYPAQAEKPVEWWWRSLAAAPYLIACQFSDVGYYVQPLLEHHETLEDLIFYIPGGAKRWSVWLPMVYCFAAYSGVVKNKKWPHFLRYHLIMAMLLETALQVVWVASNWMPLIHFNGAFGMYYWAAVGFFYIGVLLYGVRCALGGKYNKIPFVGEAALIHTNYSVGGGFHRPF